MVDEGRGMAPRRRLLLGALGGMASGLNGCGRRDAGPEPLPAVTITNLNISADGSTVVFQYGYGPRSIPGLGLYEWRTGRLTRVPTPQGQGLRMASFSYDGRRLAAVLASTGVDCALATVELATMKLTQIAESVEVPNFVSYPVFQPGNKKVLYCDDRWPQPTGIRIATIADRKDEQVLASPEGFFRIARPSFVSDSEIWFRAIGPSALRFKNGGIDAGAEYSYRLRMGGLPERLLPSLEDVKPPYPVSPGYGGDLSCSKDGEVVIGLGLNVSTPFKPDKSFNYEVFRIEADGSPTQLTDVHGYLGFCRVSYDGTTVCFGDKATRYSRADLCVLDIGSREVTRTGLLDKLSERADFLPQLYAQKKV